MIRIYLRIYNAKKKLIFLLLLLLPIVSAVSVTNITLKSNTQNYQIFVNNTINVNLLRATPYSIEIYNLSTSGIFTNTGSANSVLSFYNLQSAYPNNDIRWDNGTIILLNATDTNVSIPSGRYIEVNDFTRPYISIISPLEGHTIYNYVTGDLSIPVNFSVNDSNLQTCWYSIAGPQTITNTTTPCLNGYNNFTFTLSSAGNFQLTVYANDTVGNENSTSINFTISPYTGPQTGGGGGQDQTYTYNNSIICEEVYYFTIEYLIDGEMNYTEDDLNQLRQKITDRIGLGITSSTIIPFLDDYTLCHNYTILRLPQPEIPILNLSTLKIFDFPECSTLFNNSFLDLYIPFFRIELSNINCGKIDNYRVLFFVEQEDNDLYYIRGLKVWWMIIILMVYLSYIFIKFIISLEDEEET